MIRLKQLLMEELRDNGIVASIEPFRAVAEWDSAYQRFVFDGKVWAKLQIKTLNHHYLTYLTRNLNTSKVIRK